MQVSRQDVSKLDTRIERLELAKTSLSRRIAENKNLILETRRDIDALLRMRQDIETVYDRYRYVRENMIGMYYQFMFIQQAAIRLTELDSVDSDRMITARVINIACNKQGEYWHEVNRLELPFIETFNELLREAKRDRNGGECNVADRYYPGEEE